MAYHQWQASSPLHQALGRSSSSQPVAVAGAHQHAHALSPEQPEIAAAAGEHRVAADVAGRHLRVEGAAHPDGRREAAGVGDERVAGAQDLSVRAEDGQLAGGGDDLAVRGAPGRRDPVAVVLGRPRLGGEVEQREVLVREGDARQHGCGRQHGRGAVGLRYVVDGPRCRWTRGRERRRDVRDVDGTGRLGVVLHHAADEPGAVAAARLEVGRLVLQRDQRVLVLEPLGREVAVEAGPLGPGGGAGDELVRVRGPADPAAGGRDDDPRHPLTGHVLPHGQRDAVVRRLDRGHVEVLADVVLVVGDRALRCQCRVVGEHGVDPHGRRAAVDHLEVPRPGQVVLPEGEGEAVVEPFPGAGRDQGVVDDPDAARRVLAEQGSASYDLAPLAEDAQVHVGRTRLDARRRVEEQAEVARPEARERPVGVGLDVHPRRGLEPMARTGAGPLDGPHGDHPYQPWTPQSGPWRRESRCKKTVERGGCHVSTYMPPGG